MSRGWAKGRGGAKGTIRGRDRPELAACGLP